MQLTTPQIYALFGILAAAVFLIGLSYMTGLRTGRRAGETEGYQHGRTTAGKYWKGHIAGLKENRDASVKNLHKALDDGRATLEQAIADASALRKELENEQQCCKQLDSHIGRLRDKALTADDLLTLQLAARQLGTAAKAFARTGSQKLNQAELAQQALKDIAARYSEGKATLATEQEAAA